MKAKSVLQCLAAACLVLFSQWAVAGPKIEHWLAPSGARVYFVENRVLPMLDIQVDFTAGGARDPESKTGLASLTNALLEMGAAAVYPPGSAIADTAIDLLEKLNQRLGYAQPVPSRAPA